MLYACSKTRVSRDEAQIYSVAKTICIALKTELLSEWLKRFLGTQTVKTDMIGVFYVVFAGQHAHPLILIDTFIIHALVIIATNMNYQRPDLLPWLHLAFRTASDTFTRNIFHLIT